MAGERPPFSDDPQEAITPEFLSGQISLPREQWSAAFNAYVEQKIQEGQPRVSFEARTPEEVRRDSFDRYMRGIGISEPYLKDKRIIDLGSGDGEFVEECIEKGITKEVFGIDVQKLQAAERHQENFFQGDIQEPLPVKDADYVVSVGAVSVFEDTLDLERVLDNALASIKEDGEIRIYPIGRSYPGSDLVGLDESYKRWNELLATMAAEGKIEWTLQPVDINVAGKDNDVWLQELLIIKKPSPERESPFFALREKSYAEMGQELERRLKENPHPTDHELRIGAFEEEIEPQMREALNLLYGKGYSTESSGFGGISHAEIQQVDGYFEIDAATEEKLKTLGAWVTREYMDYYHATLTRIEFRSDKPDIRKIAQKWKEIVDALPVIGKPSYSLSYPSAEFRKQYLGEDEAQRIHIEISLERGTIPDDERVAAEEWLRNYKAKHERVTFPRPRRVFAKITHLI